MIVTVTDCRIGKFLARNRMKGAGLIFETRAVSSLNSLFRGLCVTHCGGRDDRGIDFSGTWTFAERSVVVLGQCKAHARKIGPNVIRETTSVVAREPGALGLVASESGFSKEAYRAHMAAQAPLMLLELVAGDSEALKVATLATNPALTEYLPALRVGSALNDDGTRRPMLLHDNDIISK